MRVLDGASNTDLKSKRVKAANAIVSAHEKAHGVKLAYNKNGALKPMAVRGAAKKAAPTSKSLGARIIKSRNARSISTLQGTRTAKSTPKVVAARRAAINQLFTHRGPGGKANAPRPGGSGADHG